MLDSKFFFTLIGLIVSVFAICNTNMSPAINEGFGMNPSGSIKVVREVVPRDKNRNPTSGGYSTKNTYQSMLGNNNVVSYPNFQGALSPRFNNTQIGAQIRYNIPDQAHMAAPYHPLAFGNMATKGYNGNNRENFGCSSGRCNGSCNGSCGKGGVSPKLHPAMSHNPNYTSAMNQIKDSEYNTDVLSDGMVQVGDMTTINASGEVDQPIIYDRFIHSMKKSNLHSQGDFIRGDLAIAPCEGQWFNVHPTPHLDLNAGAMHVMGGYDNETAKNLAELMHVTSGGYQTTMGGMDLNMSNSYETSLSNSGGDIQVTGFI